MMFGTRDEFDYIECARCGTVQIADAPSNLADYYPADYFSFASAERTDLGETLGRRLAARAAGKYLLTGKGALGKLVIGQKPWIADHFPPSLSEPVLEIDRDSRILDFGCGNGRLLQALHYFGFTRLEGADAFIERDIAYSTGVKVFKRSLAELEPAYDLVMLHHSFEHFADPRSALLEIRRLLMRGKFALIRMPVANFAWGKYGVNWVQLDPPRHLFLYTERAFHELAEGCGFKLEKVVYDSSSFQFWGSEQYIKDIPLTDPRSHNVGGGEKIFTQEQLDNWQDEAEKLNREGRGDQAAFYLRAL